jgi:hypothetical protein
MNSTSATPAWRRSRSCDSSSCVEAAVIGNEIAVRDSKDPSGPILRFTPAEWDAFVAGVQNGEFEFDLA